MLTLFPSQLLSFLDDDATIKLVIDTLFAALYRLSNPVLVDGFATDCNDLSSILSIAVGAFVAAVTLSLFLFFFFLVVGSNEVTPSDDTADGTSEEATDGN
jgi:hypothetical protein